MNLVSDLSARGTMTKMRGIPINDFFAKNGRIRQRQIRCRLFFGRRVELCYRRL
jgi:hypothetical protein